MLTPSVPLEEEKKAVEVKKEQPAPIPKLAAEPLPAAAAQSVLPKYVELKVELEGDEKKDLRPTIEDAFKYYTTEQEIASHIKSNYDIKHTPTWHCVVGTLICSYC